MIDVATENDTADMVALKSGDQEALDRLMNRWQSALRGFLFRATQDEAAALDLAQETFVRVYQNAARFRTDARFSTWLFAIATNLLRDRARRLKRRPTVPLESIAEPAGTGTPAGALVGEERVEAVREAIAALPDDLRTAVVLFEYEEKSHAEIGEIVGATPKAVETRLYRARQLLKKSLSRYLV
jgi:RNA polymerase sigma factor (sigma-70 family)